MSTPKPTNPNEFLIRSLRDCDAAATVVRTHPHASGYAFLHPDFFNDFARDIAKGATNPHFMLDKVINPVIKKPAADFTHGANIGIAVEPGCDLVISALPVATPVGAEPDHTCYLHCTWPFPEGLSPNIPAPPMIAAEEGVEDPSRVASMQHAAANWLSDIEIYGEASTFLDGADVDERGRAVKQLVEYMIHNLAVDVSKMMTATFTYDYPLTTRDQHELAGLIASGHAAPAQPPAATIAYWPGAHPSRGAVVADDGDRGEEGDDAADGPPRGDGGLAAARGNGGPEAPRADRGRSRSRERADRGRSRSRERADQGDGPGGPAALPDWRERRPGGGGSKHTLRRLKGGGDIEAGAPPPPDGPPPQLTGSTPVKVFKAFVLLGVTVGIGTATYFFTPVLESVLSGPLGFIAPICQGSILEDVARVAASLGTGGRIKNCVDSGKRYNRLVMIFVGALTSMSGIGWAAKTYLLRNFNDIVDKLLDYLSAASILINPCSYYRGSRNALIHFFQGHDALQEHWRKAHSEEVAATPAGTPVAPIDPEMPFSVNAPGSIPELRANYDEIMNLIREYNNLRHVLSSGGTNAPATAADVAAWADSGDDEGASASSSPRRHASFGGIEKERVDKFREAASSASRSDRGGGVIFEYSDFQQFEQNLKEGKISLTDFEVLPCKIVFTHYQYDKLQAVKDLLEAMIKQMSNSSAWYSPQLKAWANSLSVTDLGASSEAGMRALILRSNLGSGLAAVAPTFTKRDLLPLDFAKTLAGLSKQIEDKLNKEKIPPGDSAREFLEDIKKAEQDERDSAEVRASDSVASNENAYQVGGISAVYSLGTNMADAVVNIARSALARMGAKRELKELGNPERPRLERTRTLTPEEYAYITQKVDEKIAAFHGAVGLHGAPDELFKAVEDLEKTAKINSIAKKYSGMDVPADPAAEINGIVDEEFAPAAHLPGPGGSGKRRRNKKTIKKRKKLTKKGKKKLKHKKLTKRRKRKTFKYSK